MELASVTRAIVAAIAFALVRRIPNALSECVVFAASEYQVESLFGFDAKICQHLERERNDELLERVDCAEFAFQADSAFVREIDEKRLNFVE